MSYGADGRVIGPTQEVIDERKRLDEEARVKLARERALTQQARDAERLAAERAEQALVNKKMQEDARAAWLANGGTEVEFVQHWPSLRVQLLQQKVVAAQEEERLDFARRLYDYGGKM